MKWLRITPLLLRKAEHTFIISQATPEFYDFEQYSENSFMILGVRVDVKIIWANAAYDIWALGYGSDMYLLYSALDINM